MVYKRIDVRQGWGPNYPGDGSLDTFLANRRSRLEEIVAPWISSEPVTEQTSGHVILFRGTLQTLAEPKLDPPIDDDQFRAVAYAVAALQSLYFLGFAREQNDADTAANQMAAFMSYNVEVENYERHDSYIVDAMIRVSNLVRTQRDNGKNSAKWKDEYEPRARTILAEVSKENVSMTEALKRTARRLFDEGIAGKDKPLSYKTVGRGLKLF